MTETFYTSIIPLASPVTIYLPTAAWPRPRVISNTPDEQTMEPFTLEYLDVAFWVAPLTQSIHAQIANVPVPLLIYGPADFSHVVTDATEHHAARLMQILGDDPAVVLQALCDRTELPPMPARVPREIANWRARAVLELAGLLPAVEAAIQGMAGAEGVVVRNAWLAGAPLARAGATVTALAPALGLTDEQVDAMFIQADALDV